MHSGATMDISFLGDGNDDEIGGLMCFANELERGWNAGLLGRLKVATRNPGGCMLSCLDLCLISSVVPNSCTTTCPKFESKTERGADGDGDVEAAAEVVVTETAHDQTQFPHREHFVMRKA